MQGPILDRVALQTQGKAVVAKVNVDNAPGVATTYGIQSIPTLAAFRGGREVQRVSGALPLEELRRFAAAAVSVGD